MVTEEELSMIEARAKAATPGPWHVEERTLEITEAGVAHNVSPRSTCEVRTAWVHGQLKDTYPVTPLWLSPFYSPNSHVGMEATDAHFIATARTDVPALVAEVRRLRAMIVPRSTPPTDAELEAHWERDSAWLVQHVHCNSTDRPASVLRGPAAAEHAALQRRHPHGYPSRWWALGPGFAPCSWPTP